MRKWDWARYTPNQLAHALRAAEDDESPASSTPAEIAAAVAEFRRQQGRS